MMGNGDVKDESFYMSCSTFFQLVENFDSLEVHILSGGGKLQISRSQPSDSGNYTCIASNVEGKAQKSYFLSIQGTAEH